MKLVTKEEFRKIWDECGENCVVPEMYPPVLVDKSTKQIICIVYEGVQIPEDSGRVGSLGGVLQRT